MLRTMTLSLAIALTCPLFVRAAEPKDEEAKAIAVKVTTAGATLFDAKDAAALAATFTEEARLEATYKSKDESSSKVGAYQSTSMANPFRSDSR